LPGKDSPEVWIWDTLRKNPDHYQEILGIPSEQLAEKIKLLDNLFDAAADKPGTIAMNKVYSLAEMMARLPRDLIRLIAKAESERREGEVHEIGNQLEDAVRQWRSAST
jgi:hypothetical protein